MQATNESFGDALETHPEVIGDVLESAVEIAWVMGTLVPPAVFHEPQEYHKEWHDLIAIQNAEVDPESDDCHLMYCRPILFFGAEGTVGRMGSVKCLRIPAPNIPETSAENRNPLLQSRTFLQEPDPTSVELNFLTGSPFNNDPHVPDDVTPLPSHLVTPKQPPKEKQHTLGGSEAAHANGTHCACNSAPKPASNGRSTRHHQGHQDKKSGSVNPEVNPPGLRSDTVNSVINPPGDQQNKLD